MTQISQSDASPAFLPAPLVGPVCDVFAATTAQVAQASLPATAVAFTTIGAAIGSLIAAQLPSGLVLATDALSTLIMEVLAGLVGAGRLAVDACLPAGVEPTLAAHLLEDQIITCGSVDVIVTCRTTAPFTDELHVRTTTVVPIRVTVPAGTIGSTMVTLSMQGEEAAPGVLPSDRILERVVRAEGITTRLLGGTTVDARGGLLPTTLVSIRASYVVSMQVVRVLNPSLPTVAEVAMEEPDPPPDLPPDSAVRSRKQRTIVWSLVRVEEKRSG